MTESVEVRQPVLDKSLTRSKSINSFWAGIAGCLITRHSIAPPKINMGLVTGR